MYLYTYSGFTNGRRRGTGRISAARGPGRRVSAAAAAGAAAGEAGEAAARRRKM